MQILQIKTHEEEDYMDICLKITQELNIKKTQVEAAVNLIDEGNTIPFISRYRKEVTGALNDEQLRDLHERLQYLRNLEEKKEQVLKSIEEQGALTEELKEKILERNKKRRDSQPLNSPSNGSVFRNPVGFAAGKLIDDLGLKGTRINDAVISDKHANFIVNDGNATSGDIIKLIKLIKKEVKKAYNIDLILEQEIIK